MSRTYLILGASSDIGFSYLHHLEDLGVSATVFAVGNHGISKIKDTAYQNITVHPYSCDLSKKEEIDQLMKEILQVSSMISHVLHLAAVPFQYLRASQFSYERICCDFQVQVASIGLILQQLLPKMKKNHFGRTVFMTSSCTIGMPPKNLLEYHTVKYALVGMIRSYAAEFSAYNMTFNGIAPAMVETKFWEKVPEYLVELNKQGQPGGSCISLEEIHHTIDFLFSESTTFINGENINLSGGGTM